MSNGPKLKTLKTFFGNIFDWLGWDGLVVGNIVYQIA